MAAIDKVTCVQPCLKALSSPPSICLPFQVQTKMLFSSALSHSYTAFRQATLLYEERADDKEFDDLCRKVASAVTMHPEFLYLLRKVEKDLPHRSFGPNNSFPHPLSKSLTQLIMGETSLSQDVCLGCDRQTDGKAYCGEGCRRAELNYSFPHSLKRPREKLA